MTISSNSLGLYNLLNSFPKYRHFIKYYRLCYPQCKMSDYVQITSQLSTSFRKLKKKNSKSLGTHRKIFKKNFLSTVCISVYSSYLEWFYFNAREWIFFFFCLTRKYNFDIQLKIYVIFIPSVLPPILPILYQIGKNTESWEVWNNKKKDCLMAECIFKW